MKKYIKLLILTITFFTMSIFTTNILATTEDLTLSRIYVEPGTLEPEFSETRKYYTLLLDENVTNLLVQATPTNEALKYEIKGNEELKIGENIITITVYGENNNTNTYTINALKTNEPDKYNTLLSTLIIDNYPFNEDFFPETFDYTAKDTTTADSVEVFAYAQNPNAKVEIKGNENLKDGNNIITVTVTSENGLATRTYTVNLTKSNTISTIENTDTNISQNDKSEFYTFLITSIIIIIILISIILIFRKKNNK